MAKLRAEIAKRRAEGPVGQMGPMGPARGIGAATGEFEGGWKNRIWMSAVGMTGEDAAAMIREDRPDLREIIIVKAGSMMTMDMRMDRVRIVVNDENKVVHPPHVG
ncbi:unnamed protein product [Phaeothamnion confervicola]